MTQKKLMFIILICLLSSFIVLSGCSNDSPSSLNETSSLKGAEKYEKEVKNKNKQLDLKPLELTSYSDEIGVTLKAPKYKKFAVNGQVVVEATIKNSAQLKSDYAWIKVSANEDGPAGKELEYYAPIKNGKFKQKIHFFNGEGEYKIKVQLPSTEQKDYYYDIATFEVINVHPEIIRDISYTSFGQDAKLDINLESSFLKADGVFSLTGKSGKLTDADSIMIKLKKGNETWKHIIPLKNGQFAFDIPLLYGNGMHELEVYVPEGNRANYYQMATTILINNESSKKLKPITFADTYLQRGIKLDYPKFGGAEADTSFKIKGSIDPKAKFAGQTTHLFITIKKGKDEALEVIPMENFAFDDSFLLRFGPGTYEIILSVPEITTVKSNSFNYFGVAEFEVKSNTAKDLRDILPSRGVESDSPQIKNLAGEITSGKSSDREKAKAVYEYVAKNIAYDVDKLENMDFEWDDSALKTLRLKQGVCQDYSYLAIALLRASGIEARFIEGYAGERHAWVEVKVNGGWLTMDPTWGSGYIRNDRFVADFNESYFDPNMQEFNKTHSRIGVAY